MSVFSVCVKPAVALLTLLPVALAVAADNALPQAPAPLASAGKVLFFLALIILLILATAWLLSKTRGVQLRQGQGKGKVNVVATLPLGMKEKIAVIQVGDKQMVVGVTAQQITHLADLDEPLPQETAASALTFQELLKKAIRS